MVSPAGQSVSPEAFNALVRRVAEIDASVTETNRKIQTASAISGAIVGAGAGAVVGYVYPPAGWATYKAVAAYGAGGGLAGAGVGGLVGHALTQNPN